MLCAWVGKRPFIRCHCFISWWPVGQRILQCLQPLQPPLSSLPAFCLLPPILVRVRLPSLGFMLVARPTMLRKLHLYLTYVPQPSYFYFVLRTASSCRPRSWFLDSAMRILHQWFGSCHIEHGGSFKVARYSTRLQYRLVCICI